MKTENQNPEPEKKLSLTEKMFNIMCDVGIIEKDKTNDFHKYPYASEFAIKKAVREQLIKNRIMFSINLESYVNEPHIKEGLLTTAIFNYQFYDVDSKEVISGRFLGAGSDKGDKGFYKAVTGAIKYILTSTFLIPTGDDPEKAEDHKTNGEVKLEDHKPGNIEPNTAKKPDLSSAQCTAAFDRIIAGELGVYERVFEMYTVSRQNKILLDTALSTAQKGAVNV